MNDKVIQAFPDRSDLPECPVKVERGTHAYCWHKRITINEHERSVVCAECFAVLDPFDYLRSGANALISGWREYEQVKRRVDELRENCAALDKEKKRLSGMVRRLKEKPGIVLDVRKTL